LGKVIIGTFPEHNIKSTPSLMIKFTDQSNRDSTDLLKEAFGVIRQVKNISNTEKTSNFAVQKQKQY
jgi:hypothetical protein